MVVFIQWQRSIIYQGQEKRRSFRLYKEDNINENQTIIKSNDDYLTPILKIGFIDPLCNTVIKLIKIVSHFLSTLFRHFSELFLSLFKHIYLRMQTLRIIPNFFHAIGRFIAKTIIKIISHFFYEMGNYFDHVAKNYEKALFYYDKAVRKNHSSAIANVGLLYLEGKGVQKNFSEALNCFQKAAQLGDAKGYLNIGLLYEEGVYVEKNNFRALDNYLKAADLNDKEASTKLVLIIELRTSKKRTIH